LDAISANAVGQAASVAHVTNVQSRPRRELVLPIGQNNWSDHFQMSPRTKQHPSQSAVFERLLRDIVSGRHDAGQRLPAERDLARQLGASRPTLREALRRLGEWRMVEARRGSGVVVRPARDWSFAALPAYLGLGAPGLGPDKLGQLVTDMLGVRRGLFVEVLRQVAPRIATGYAALANARKAISAAWDARADRAEFVLRDLDVFRSIVEAAGFLPAVWILNDVADVYLDVARGLPIHRTPDDYAASYTAVVDALERGQGDKAVAELDAYLARHDRRLLIDMGLHPKGGL
jgi:DNA-binding FadR family transcriptional regulator